MDALNLISVHNSMSPWDVPIADVPILSSHTLETPLENAQPFEVASTQIRGSSADEVPFLETPSIDVEINNDYPKNKPRTSLMFMHAIRHRSNGGRRSGASLQSIKKYIESSFQVNIDKRKHLIKQSLLDGVATGKFVQLSGQGVNGSFRMANRKMKKVAKTKSGVSKRKVASKNKLPIRLKRKNSVNSKTESKA